MKSRQLGGQCVEINLLVAGFEEYPLTTVSTLRHMVRNAGENNARLPSHDHLMMCERHPMPKYSLCN